MGNLSDLRHPKGQVVPNHQCLPKVSLHDWPLCSPLMGFLESWLKVVNASSKAHQDENGDHQIHGHKPIQEVGHGCQRKGEKAHAVGAPKTHLYQDHKASASSAVPRPASQPCCTWFMLGCTRRHLIHWERSMPLGSLLGPLHSVSPAPSPQRGLSLHAPSSAASD